MSEPRKMKSVKFTSVGLSPGQEVDLTPEEIEEEGNDILRCLRTVMEGPTPPGVTEEIMVWLPAMIYKSWRAGREYERDLTAIKNLPEAPK